MPFEYYTGYNVTLLDNARNLRRNMTAEERHLWYDYLRNYLVKFYRQRAIDNYIADFYSNGAELVIEIDGSQHYSEEGKIYDERRTCELSKYGLIVINLRTLI